MENAKVAILLSTYNGAEYLAEQIDSIVHQTYSAWQLYIRDDGSTDQTGQIIQKYQASDQRIVFLNEGQIENLGVKRSFMALLSAAQADFYMFCDQDDVWLPKKIETTLAEMLKKNVAAAPRLIHTDLMVVDQKLQSQKVMFGRDFQDAFRDVLYSNSVTGCTVMINESLRQLLLAQPFDPQQIVMHDWWFALVAAAFGEIDYLAEPTILYRQHGDNTFGADASGFQRLRRFFKMEQEIERFTAALKQDDYFAQVYGQDPKLSAENKRYLQATVTIRHSKNSLTALSALYKSKARKSTLKGTLLMWYVLGLRHNAVKRSAEE
ncbi:glycosyltransferase family 2 protein [Loigolactobacillus coryniformis]|uniref:glycosyltransferase family 2 protein n=1 Tax=Loigolactobacillus coryniformis TaxID=1610 RepID=UPI00234073AE|nr:glycosyltransferase family 2 protein [Loigolactobacillus coryniformis]MDC4186160.1 glycosyltransferase family 2 protein [Loigolactobacillus coryniformis]